MLIFDFNIIGNKLYTVRKKSGMTQSEVAESAGISDRTYADIERGVVNMRVETLLRICNSLKITPNEVLLTECKQKTNFNDIFSMLEKATEKEKTTALEILNAYLKNI